MMPGPTEEIPNQHIIAELEAQLLSRTSELVIANARIRARDETISSLREQLAAATYRNDQRHDPESP